MEFHVIEFQLLLTLIGYMPSYLHGSPVCVYMSVHPTSSACQGFGAKRLAPRLPAEICHFYGSASVATNPLFCPFVQESEQGSTPDFCFPGEVNSPDTNGARPWK